MGLSGFSIPSRECQICLFARNCQMQEAIQRCPTMIPPFKESGHNTLSVSLVNDVEIEIDFVFVVLGLNETY